jgi:hypothetical protein
MIENIIVSMVKYKQFSFKHNGNYLVSLLLICAGKYKFKTALLSEKARNRARS